MTAAPELALQVHPAAPGLPAWRPTGREPQACMPSAARDASCVSDAVYEVEFTLGGDAGAHTVIWLYAAAQADRGGFIIAWRWMQFCGSLDDCTFWCKAGWNAATEQFLTPEAADDAALEVAAQLACGGGDRFLGGHFTCLDWDGRPW